jgi:hypothetical protein
MVADECDAMVQRVVRAFPVLPGKEHKVREFAQELAARGGEAGDFYGQFGVCHESWHLQETATGPWIIGVTEIRRMPVSAAAQQYKVSERPFDRWFKDQVREISGVNPDDTPLGPPTECIFNWSLAGQPIASSR